MEEDKVLVFETKKGSRGYFNFVLGDYPAGIEAGAVYVFETIVVEKFVAGDEQAILLMGMASEDTSWLDVKSYIKSIQPKKYKVSLNRYYKIQVHQEFELEADNEEEAMGMAVDNLDFNSFCNCDLEHSEDTVDEVNNENN